MIVILRSAARFSPSPQPSPVEGEGAMKKWVRVGLLAALNPPARRVSVATLRRPLWRGVLFL